jgi:hypothetical protein
MKTHSFFKLLNILKAPFVNFFNIFNKDFFKERRYLHFAFSFVIVLLFLVIGHVVKELQIDQLPFWFILILGWFIAYFANFTREHYYARKGAKWDWFDIYTGSYGGLTASLIYIFITWKN